jgi:predicted DNA-binding ribbon-helix-helix protein
MPSLSLSIPNSTWQKLKIVADHEGVTVRALVIDRICDTAAEAKAIQRERLEVATEAVA